MIHITNKLNHTVASFDKIHGLTGVLEIDTQMIRNEEGMDIIFLIEKTIPTLFKQLIVESMKYFPEKYRNGVIVYDGRSCYSSGLSCDVTMNEEWNSTPTEDADLLKGIEYGARVLKERENQRDAMFWMFSNSGVEYEEEEMDIKLKEYGLPENVSMTIFDLGERNNLKTLQYLSLLMKGVYVRDFGKYTSFVEDFLKNTPTRVNIELKAHDGARIVNIICPYTIHKIQDSKIYSVSVGNASRVIRLVYKISLRSFTKQMNHHLFTCTVQTQEYHCFIPRMNYNEINVKEIEYIKENMINAEMLSLLLNTMKSKSNNGTDLMKNFENEIPSEYSNDIKNFRNEGNNFNGDIFHKYISKMLVF